MYSKDSGRAWQHVRDDSTATPGVKPSATYVRSDGGLGQESYVWSVPATAFPQGTYILRVEAYRDNQELHYAQHQMYFFIDR